MSHVSYTELRANLAKHMDEVATAARRSSSRARTRVRS